MPRITRRGLAVAGASGVLLAQARPLPKDFPREDSRLTQEVVGVAHFNEKRVRELVEAHPFLVNACWDWGFGDFETPLGAASHTGQRAIAEYLLSKGARLDLFAAAMLGMTDVVKAMVAARPGVQRTWGPHGIPLLLHAKAGGPKAAETLTYLESLGDAGDGPPSAPVTDERVQMVMGRYQANGRTYEVRKNSRGLLQLVPGAGEDPKNLVHKGGDVYYPSGVPSAGFRFEIREGKARTMTFLNPEAVFTASRLD